MSLKVLQFGLVLSFLYSFPALRLGKRSLSLGGLHMFGLQTTRYTFADSSFDRIKSVLLFSDF